MLTLKRFAAVTTLLLTLAALGCESGPSEVEVLQPELALSTTQNNILVGETTTVFAETTNLLGRQVEINWSTTLGQIEPTNEGRMARFTSEVPGTAVVTAEMRVNGQVLRESTNITVNSMR